MKGRRGNSKAQPIRLSKLELTEQVASLRRSLKGRPESEHRKLDDFEKTSVMLDIVRNQALSGNKLSGAFLAVLAFHFNKHKARLEQANEAFRMHWAKLESARFATKRSKGLREKIEKIMAEADLFRRVMVISKRVAKDKTDYWQNDPVLKLPPPDYRSEAVIGEWSGYVYSELRKMDLAKQPGIGDQKRYRDKNGKFQVSRLRSEVPNIVKRIFRVWNAQPLP